MAPVKKALLEHRLLTKTEETALARAARSGEPAEARRATEKLVLHNIKLVASIATRHYHPPQGMDQDDLLQAGILGLMRAAQTYDPDTGHRFSTYATYWTRQSIGRQVENTGTTIRIPVHLQQRAARLRRTHAALSNALGREPTKDELARDSDILAAKVHPLEKTVALGASPLTLYELTTR